MAARRNYVYVHNMGATWKLTAAEWRAFCEEAQTPDWGGYNLDDYRPALAQNPWWLRRDRDSGTIFTYSDHHLVVPVDWEPEDFAAAIVRLDDWLKGPKPKLKFRAVNA